MSTQFRPIEIPPGVVATGTKKQRSSNWAEANLVRWREGQLMPVGGQVQLNYSFASRCKAIHAWYDKNQILRIAYLCEAHLYVDAGGGVLTDISPSPSVTPPGAISLGGYGAGLYGSDVYGEPRVISPIQMLDKMPSAYSLDNFGSILYAMTSSDGRLLMWDPGAGAAGNVANLAAASAILTSSPNITMPTNPGSVTPGMSVYNTSNSTFVGTVSTYVGTALVLTANAANAGVIGNVLAFGNVAVVQPAATGRGPVPHGRCFVVTPERFIVIFGSVQDGTADGGSFRRFAWCDQENPSAWDYSSVTSMAGFLDIEPASPIVAAMSTRSGVLFWTAKKAYLSRFLGMPYIYNYTELADNCTPWSPQSMTTTSSMAVWMSEQGAFAFDGTSILPVGCPVRSWVDDDIDRLNVREQACAVHVENFNEIWWFFPQLGRPYNTRAIIYNYKEGWWSQARMARSAGTTAAYNVHTIMANGTVAFIHESGLTYSADAALPFAETFDLNITGTAQLITIKQMIPDIEAVGILDPAEITDAIQTLRYSLFYRRSRSVGESEQQSPKVPVRPDGYVDFRTTGRDIRLRIESIGPSVLPVTVGQHLIDAVPRGDR